MEKLIQLLNEFKEGKPFQFIGYDEKYWMFDTNLNAEGNTSLPEETITSKKFWFIQWLVDKDKIDIQWAKNLLYESEIFNPLPYTDLAERLIMYVSIKDEPIEFLISILK